MSDARMSLSGRAPARPSVICVMPVKNEAWILKRSLSCAATWADQIIVADQGSTDGSVEIARACPKVRVLSNVTGAYSEAVRQSLLLRAARAAPAPRVILSLDADEVLAANFEGNSEWHRILEAQPGTLIRFPKAELLADP